MFSKLILKYGVLLFKDIMLFQKDLTILQTIWLFVLNVNEYYSNYGSFWLGKIVFNFQMYSFLKLLIDLPRVKDVS